MTERQEPWYIGCHLRKANGRVIYDVSPLLPELHAAAVEPGEAEEE